MPMRLEEDQTKVLQEAREKKSVHPNQRNRFWSSVWADTNIDLFLKLPTGL